MKHVVTMYFLLKNFFVKPFRILGFCIVIICCVLCIQKYKERIALFNTAPLCKDCNILLISLDTCGAKHMSTYGYERDTTPYLTALAKKGILFTNMHANATWTLPSHVSIFTGVFPYVHTIDEARKNYLSPSFPLLPEILQKYGYKTYFFAPQGEDTIAREHVYNRGIDYWNDEYWQYRGKNADYFKKVDAILTKNTDENEKTFVFFHTYACHGPYYIENQSITYTNEYMPWIPLKKSDVYDAPLTSEYYQYLLYRLPIGLKDGTFNSSPEKMKSFLEHLQNANSFEEAKTIYQDAYKHSFWGESIMNQYLEKFNYWDKIDWTDQNEIAYAKALYDQRLHTLDKNLLGLLREKLSKSSWAKNTLVIITADHGEEFMEHGEYGHITVYDFNTQVPLVLLAPNMTGQSIHEHVQSVDIFPTILDIVGIPNTYTFNGVSLLPLIHGKTLGKRLIISEGQYTKEQAIFSVREDDWKLLIAQKENSLQPYQLFNTRSDPEEQNNVFNQHTSKIEAMMKAYMSLINK